MAASPSDRGSGRGLIITLVVLIVAALGGVGYLLLRPSDNESEAAGTPPASTTAPAAPAAPASTSAAPAGTTVTHTSGKFSVVLPANGWQSKADAESGIAPGSPVVQFAPDLAVYAKGAGRAVGFAIVDLTGTKNTPEQYVANAKESNFAGCEWSKPKVFEYKDFTGTFVERKACSVPASDGAKIDYDAIQLGVSRADGVTAGMVIRDAPNETSTRLLALAALETMKHL